MRENKSWLILRDGFCTCTGLTKNILDWKGPLEVSPNSLLKAGPVRACCSRPCPVELLNVSKITLQLHSLSGALFWCPTTFMVKSFTSVALEENEENSIKKQNRNK